CAGGIGYSFDYW
nr:immunoglobulin heavy chain junction region [Macaca mulatta]